MLPGTRLPARLLVQEDDDRPDLLFGEEILPCGHRGIPRRAFLGQANAALGDAPEHEALGELRDGAVVAEVERRGAEAVRVVAFAVERIAVTRQAVLVIDLLA